jgi:hypothetical protein
MNKRIRDFEWNEFGVAKNPEILFSASSSQMVIKIFRAKWNEFFFSGYQVSIYMASDAGISELKLPRILHGNGNQRECVVETEAIKKALDILVQCIQKEPILKIYPAFKRFINYVQSQAIEVPISLI